MGFFLLCAGVALVFFLFQLLMARKARRWPWRLLPLWLDFLVAFYAFLRFVDVLNYPYDGGFLDGGVLTGLILLIFCLAALVGITLCWLIVLIQYRIKKARS
ncbi:MAG: hypothetical protein E7449_04910 [Ruminococcaceae bacterium]|nr:hypothetical protein [Oscillospiraceae bacterium]